MSTPKIIKTVLGAAMALTIGAATDARAEIGPLCTDLVKTLGEREQKLAQLTEERVLLEKRVTPPLTDSGTGRTCGCVVIQFRHVGDVAERPIILKSDPDDRAWHIRAIDAIYDYRFAIEDREVGVAYGVLAVEVYRFLDQFGNRPKRLEQCKS